MIIISIAGSSAAVIVTERDGVHSPPFHFASPKYCFIQYFFVKLNELLSTDHLCVLIYLQPFDEDKAFASVSNISITTLMTNHPEYSFL